MPVSQYKVYGLALHFTGRIVAQQIAEALKCDVRNERTDGLEYGMGMVSAEILFTSKPIKMLNVTLFPEANVD